MKKGLLVLGLVAAAALAGCIKTESKVEIAPIEVKPVHLTIDINVRVEKQLDDFFGDLDNQ